MADDKEKKRRGLFGLFGGRDEFFENIDDMFERMRDEMEEEMDRMKTFRIQADENRLKELSSNPNVKVYGYSMRIGEDGKPKFREFGNVKPRKEPEGPTMKEGEPEPATEGSREPLVDMFTAKNKTTVVAELPGVAEKDINIRLEGKKLEIEVDKGQHKYYKELTLPKEFTKKKMKKSYNNGVLELVLS
ncbi:Hsp20 family protein [Candidatus Micrarchaeota archaeon]|nr:Hsp20 family protein [Candidatus Micrarchaeota archaeon]